MSSAAKARREDKNKNYAQQMQDFANDSVNFFNKCAKPDKTGKLSPALFRRVHEDLAGLRHGLPRDRVHRLYHQARVHPHQQHHSGCLRDNIDSITYFHCKPALASTLYRIP